MRVLRIVLTGLLIASGAAAITDATTDETTSLAASRENADPAPGYVEIHALARAYPGRIQEVAYREGDWALMMDGTWFYWAQGRLLPEHLRHQWSDFLEIRFYSYQSGPPEKREITPELEERLRSRMDSFERDSRIRFNSFLDTLYEISSQPEAELLIEEVEFLGHRTRVHPLLVGPLARVDERIRHVIHIDAETRRFVRDLVQVHGYNWRNIAGTARRSYHSYGIAVDLMPRSFGRQYAYWRWAVESGVEEWWNLPSSSRWQVPLPVVKAFEEEGFIWGGKWLSFDNIHFEYRPELFMLGD